MPVALYLRVSIGEPAERYCALHNVIVTTVYGDGGVSKKYYAAPPKLLLLRYGLPFVDRLML